MNELEKLIKEMEDKIMDFQRENGFDTIFDLLNEDLDAMKKHIKSNK
jgi:hypothetical protein